MLHLILADSELECIPPEIIGHPTITQSAQRDKKKPGNMLLDSSLHHQALKHLPQGARRGRPDIIHIFLLLANESIANKQGLLRVYIHTRHNEIIRINPAMNVIKNYNRFKGLCEQLFREKTIPPHGEPLMSMEKASLKTLLQEINPEVTLLFSRHGDQIQLKNYLAKQDTACIIGGFPQGDFLSPITPDATISLYHSMLPAWIVATKIIVTYENLMETPTR